MGGHIETGKAASTYGAIGKSATSARPRQLEEERRQGTKNRFSWVRAGKVAAKKPGISCSRDSITTAISARSAREAARDTPAADLPRIHAWPQ